MNVILPGAYDLRETKKSQLKHTLLHLLHKWYSFAQLEICVERRQGGGRILFFKNFSLMNK